MGSVRKCEERRTTGKSRKENPQELHPLLLWDRIGVWCLRYGCATLEPTCVPRIATRESNLTRFSGAVGLSEVRAVIRLVGTFGHIWAIFDDPNSGRACYWHLMSGVQGCSYIS